MGLLRVVMGSWGQDAASDGMKMAFIETGWRMVRADVRALFHHFLETGCFYRSQNAPSIAFIPKKSGAIELKDLRKTSLLGCTKKPVAKVLVLHHKAIVAKVVSNSWNTFVGERYIPEAVLATHEAMD